MDSPQSPNTPQRTDAQLRLVGVHEDGEHLLLSSPAGDEFFLQITDALRAATTRPIGRPSAAAADDAASHLSPREIQARIRAGASAEQLAAEFNLDLERLRTYEVPVLAERNWIATQAQSIEVSAPQLGNDLYRSVFGEEPALLGAMVRHRLTALGLDPETAIWDAWRDEDRQWTVSVDFSVQGLSSSIGDSPPAQWRFRPASKHVDNLNRWAQVLAELDPLETPQSSRRLSAVSELGEKAESEYVGSGQSSPDQRGLRDSADTDAQEELLDVLQARRGQRLGVDEDADDELALMITREEHPSNWTRPQLVVSRNDEDSDSSSTVPHLHQGVTSQTTQYTVDTDASSNEEQDASDIASDQQDEPTVQHDSADETKPRPTTKSGRKNRPSVPSWDEIMFGTKSD